MIRLRMLGEVAEVKLWDDELPPSPEELDQLLEGCDGALTLLTDHIEHCVASANDGAGRDPQAHADAAKRSRQQLVDEMRLTLSRFLR